MAKHKVLSTKKLNPSSAALAKENGIEIIEREFIQIRAIETEQQVLKNDSVVVFTSASAVHHAAVALLKGKVYCISGSTKTAVVTRFPEAEIVSTADDAAALADKIMEVKAEKVIFFCGNRRSDVLPDKLQRAGIGVSEVVVYETIETPEKVDEDFDGVLFFSPSAVSSFFKVNRLKDDTVCFAIGNATAGTLREKVKNKTIISKAPTQEAIIFEVEAFFNQHPNLK